MGRRRNDAIGKIATEITRPLIKKGTRQMTGSFIFALCELELFSVLLLGGLFSLLLALLGRLLLDLDGLVHFDLVAELFSGSLHGQGDATTLGAPMLSIPLSSILSIEKLVLRDIQTTEYEIITKESGTITLDVV